MCGVEEGKLLEAARAYIAACYTVGDGSKKEIRFPNMAGFCRYLGVGVEAFRLSMRERQEEYDTLLALFEDEALNSGLSATLVSAYLKKHLGYGEKSEGQGAAVSVADSVKLIFEHDIIADGE